MVTILSTELDTSFKYEVAAQPGGAAVKRCLACGACSGGCLIGEVTGEFDPRKIIRSIILGMKDQVLSSSSIWLCLLCGNCTFHCPQDVRFSEVMGALRYLAVKEGYLHPSFIKKLIFHSLLPSHLRLELVSRPLSLYNLLGLPGLLRSTQAIKLLPKPLANLENMAPKVPVLPLSRRVKTVTPARGNSKHKVGFFLNCADDLVFASTALASVTLLSENSCEVITPKSVQCCGMPCFGYGEMEQAQKLAKHNIDIFEKARVEAVITDCATCGSFLRDYANLLKDDAQYAERAASFSRKVQDISQFLVQTVGLKYQLASVKGQVTYHDPCHLNWAQDVSQQPRQLFKLIPGLELIEMQGSDTCCGGAGSYNITHFDTSMDILDRKIANIEATGAGLVATGCPGCRIQIGLGIKRRGLKVQVVHPVDLVKKASAKTESQTG